MKVSKWTSLTLLAALSVLVMSGCNTRTIIFKPSPEMDPMPKAAPDVSQTADPLVSEQWSLGRIGIDGDVIADGTLDGNANVTIAILSTGIDYNHEDLLGRTYVNQREVTPAGPGSNRVTNGLDDDGNGLIDDVVGYDVVMDDGFAFDRHGAGTAIAGIIAARQQNGTGITGIMGDVRLYPVRYIDDNGQTSAFHLIEALDVVVKTRPHVVMLQSTQVVLGGGWGDQAVIDSELKAIGEKLDAIRDAGIPIVIGAGNDNSLFGSQPIEQFFKSYDNVVVVTSSNTQDKLTFLANQSPQYVTTAAPGDKILTTALGNGYEKVTSTSYSAAHIVAALGLAISRHGRLPPQRLITTLLSDKGSDLVADLSMASLGRNRLNLVKYLNYLDELESH